MYGRPQITPVAETIRTPAWRSVSPMARETSAGLTLAARLLWGLLE